jgi:U6 snRNA phosphodiesterase
MTLVDYSDSEPESADQAPPSQAAPEEPSRKRRKSLGGAPVPMNSKSTLPPLPDEFYDLYASTVRTAAVDDPTLHQGRKRLTPHVVGNWPTHLYIECMPPARMPITTRGMNLK